MSAHGSARDSRENKKMPNSVSGWLLASTQSPCNGASGIRQPRTTGSSRSCMTRWQRSPSSTSSEIRLELSGADEPKVLAAPKRVTRPRPRQSHVAAVRPNAGQLQQGPTKSCSDSLLGSHALRARGSEVMPQYGGLVGPGHLGLYWFFVLDCAAAGAPGRRPCPSPGPSHWHSSRQVPRVPC